MRLMVMPVGRRPGFFRITGKKYFVLYRSQVENISYPTDHRQNLFWFFRITGKNYFVLYRAQAKTILYPTDHRQNLFWFFPDHRQKLFRTLPSTGKNYFVLYRSQAKPISYSRGITHYLSLSLSLSPLNVPKTGLPWSIPP